MIGTQAHELALEAVGIIGDAFPADISTGTGIKSLSKSLHAKLDELSSGGSNETGLEVQQIEEAKALLDLAVELVQDEKEPEPEPEPEQKPEQAKEATQKAKAVKEKKKAAAPTKVRDRTLISVFDKNSNAPVVTHTKVLGMDNIYPANGLMIVAADIRNEGDPVLKFRGGPIENPALPHDILEKLGIDPVNSEANQGPDVRMSTYLFQGGTLKYSGGIRDSEHRDNFRSLRTYVASALGNSAFASGDAICLVSDVEGGHIKVKEGAKAAGSKVVRSAIEARGRGLNKILGIPGSIEAGLERRTANTPGIHGSEFFSFAEAHLKVDMSMEAESSDQILVASVWTSDDAIAMFEKEDSFSTHANPRFVSLDRWSTFVVSAARHYCTELGGGGIMKLFSSALDRADAIRDAALTGGVSNFETAASTAFAAVARELADEIRNYAASSLFPARRSLHNRSLRRRMGDQGAEAALIRFFGEVRQFGADEAAAFISSQASGQAPLVFNRTLSDYVKEIKSCNEAMSGSLRLLKAYFSVSPTADRGIPCFTSEWVSPGQTPQVKGSIPPALWAAKMATPMKVYKSTMGGLPPFTLDMEKLAR